MEMEEPSDPEVNDINNDAFWKKIYENFQLTLELLKEMAEEHGIDLDSLDTEEAEQEENRNYENSREHPLAITSYDYSEMVNNWFESSQELLKEKEKTLNSELMMELKDSYPEKEARVIINSIEVIRWYQLQIHVKLMRALQGREDDHWEEMEGFPKDSDGSVKVSLLGMDRSIAAWGNLYEKLFSKSEKILDILIHLDRLRRKTETEFPDARKFIRPGFDEPEK
jgi:hypothetical protein